MARVQSLQITVRILTALLASASSNGNLWACDPASLTQTVVFQRSVEILTPALDFQNGGAGYAILPPFPGFTPQAIDALWNAMARFDGRLEQVSSQLSPEVYRHLDDFGQYMHSVLRASLPPAEAPRLSMPIIHLEASKSGFQRIHVDGGDFTVTVALRGAGTEIFPTINQLTNMPIELSYIDRDEPSAPIGYSVPTESVYVTSAESRLTRYGLRGIVPHAAPVSTERRLLVVMRFVIQSNGPSQR
jgi:hypothetical protein